MLFRVGHLPQDLLQAFQPHRVLPDSVPLDLGVSHTGWSGAGRGHGTAPLPVVCSRCLIGLCYLPVPPDSMEIQLTVTRKELTDPLGGQAGSEVGPSDSPPSLCTILPPPR